VQCVLGRRVERDSEATEAVETIGADLFSSGYAQASRLVEVYLEDLTAIYAHGQTETSESRVGGIGNVGKWKGTTDGTIFVDLALTWSVPCVRASTEPPGAYH